MKPANQDAQELTLATTQPLPPPATTAPSPIQMMQAMIAGGVNEKNVMAFERLAELQWKFEARDAEKEFNAAFEKFQSEKPGIVASTPVKNRGAYEKYEDIMQKDGIEKLLTKNGFTVSFDQSATGDRVTVTCTLAHSSGHKITKSYSTRCRPSDNNTQSDSMATTTAKRNALCLTLNIVIRQDILQNEDGDAGLLGDPDAFITKSQVSELQHRIGMLADAVDMPAFWKFAGATKFAEIPANKYDQIDSMLKRKEQFGR
jgi:hypothetical protein